MANNKKSGDIGELEVVELVPCPNCGKKLMLLPPSFPLIDIYCSSCNFRAQIKTNMSKPKTQILGAGWNIAEKVMKAGYLMPPLITNFKWHEKAEQHQEIRFYPFIPKNHLKKRKLSETAKRANYKMFDYIGLDELPNFLLYRK